jgi:hypothetical protein
LGDQFVGLGTSSTTHETTQQKACREATLAETTNQVNTLIGEYIHLPFSLSHEPEREEANTQLPIELADGHFAHETELADGQTEHAEKGTEHAEKQIEHAKKRIERNGDKKSTHPAERPDDWLTGPLPFVNKRADENAPADAVWPDNLISTIRNVIDIPCPTPAAPKFIFELSDDAAAHNLDVLLKHKLSLGKALNANKGSPLGYGSKFRHPDELQKFFGLHPLWPRMEAILTRGSRWPLEELCKKDHQKDLEDALTFGNHKGASAKPDFLWNLIGKDVKYGYSFPIPLSCTRGGQP